MQAHLKFIAIAAAIAVTGIASAQTATTPDSGRTAGEATRDTARAVGRAASAAVTPGDQDMGRNPGNRTGGVMGSERTGSNPTTTDSSNAGSATDNSNRNDTTMQRRTARADRG